MAAPEVRFFKAVKYSFMLENIYSNLLIFFYTRIFLFAYFALRVGGSRIVSHFAFFQVIRYLCQITISIGKLRGLYG